MPIDHNRRQAAAVEAILSSSHRRKVIVAGAGAGKTTVFEELLRRLPAGPPGNRLVVTLINALAKDLESSLGALAHVYTFHSYCYRLLLTHSSLRGNDLTSDFKYYPKLAKLVISDWRIMRGTAPPAFARFLRTIKRGPELEFHLQRASYYDAVGFDDATVRVQQAVENGGGALPRYDLVIVDEFQDFNQAEVTVLEQLARESPVVIAGDDDQALYGTLRDASEAHIRNAYADANSASFTLPYCMRCASVITEAVGDILAEATRQGLLGPRIDKEYSPYPKPAVDRLYPKVKVVRTSVQTSTANYFGRYVEQQIAMIPADEVDESHRKGFPTVLVIGAQPYLGQVRTYLEAQGFTLQTKAARQDMDELFRDEGLALIKANAKSNLGWRILLELDLPAGSNETIGSSTSGTALAELISTEYRAQVLAEAAAWEPDEPDASEAVPATAESSPTIQLSSFESSKGLSAQHVFVVGLQAPKNMNGFRVRKAVVAITRARKLCHLIYAMRVGGKSAQPSPIIGWIKQKRAQRITVDKAYWSRK